jgi:hypothetical protein
VCRIKIDEIAEEIRLISGVYKSFKPIQLEDRARNNLLSLRKNLLSYDVQTNYGEYYIDTAYSMNEEYFSEFNVKFTEKDYSMCDVTFALLFEKLV